MTGGINAEAPRECRSCFPQDTPVKCEPCAHLCTVVRTALYVVEFGRRHIREAHAAREGVSNGAPLQILTKQI
jgi:hypothetical protein